MKYIIAVIQPQKLDAVRSAVAELGVSGMTVSEVRGYGRQKGQSEVYRGAEYNVDFIPKIKMEIAVADDIAADIVALIRETANTGTIGDGKIFVLDLENVVRVRTGEEKNDAI
ncbi:MAG: P-II family nitrogen regulator [Pseudomonadota bacterium]